MNTVSLVRPSWLNTVRLLFTHSHIGGASTWRRRLCTLGCWVATGAAFPVANAQPTAPASQKRDSVIIDPKAKVVAHDKSLFGPDPDYGTPKYNYQAQLDIYGAKYLVKTQRPLLELGRDLYQSGPFNKAGTLLGSHNILIPQLLVYGDLRSAAGYNREAATSGTWGNRLNLDVDFKLTATERVHALFRPLENKGKFTGAALTGTDKGFTGNFSGEPAALFFEGDLGAMVGGVFGKDNPFDLPIAAGLMPLLFQNGVWIEDAFTGAAFTLPARNSKRLGISNLDVTFFVGANRLSNPTVGNGKDHGRIYGTNSFIEALHGYIEAGYAYVAGKNSGGQDFNSLALSFTRRYGGRVSNSVRYVGALSSTAGPGGKANGHLLLVENSLITSRPSTFVPYMNLFYGVGSPVSAARDAGAGGILKNTGLNFEADAITGFSSLNASGQDAVGGALGLNVLGANLNRQLVIEVALAHPSRSRPSLPGNQYAVGARIQQPLTNAIILRLDAMYGQRVSLSAVSGARVELRHKF